MRCKILIICSYDYIIKRLVSDVTMYFLEIDCIYKLATFYQVLRYNNTHM